MSYQFGHVDRDERIELAADGPYEERTPRWQGWHIPPVVKHAAMIGGVLVAMWGSYVIGKHHQAVSPAPAPSEKVPVIRADDQPYKVKPERAGGMEIPDRDKLIYNERAGGPPVERLLPPPEKPEPRPVAPTPAVAPPPPAPVAAAPGAAAPRAPAAQPAPREASPPQKPAPAAAGQVRVQLASVRSPQAAQEEWARLKRRFPELLGKLSANAVRADLGEKGIYYRVEAGGFATPAAAAHLCKELKRHDIGCHVVR